MKNRFLFALPLLFTLSSCVVVFYGSTSLEPISPYQDDKGEGYEKVSNFSFNLQNVKKTTKQIALDSTGDSTILVVPVQFSGSPSWTQSKISVVEKGFFGAASETSWQSVSSYYAASSYGKLNITGEVAPVLQMSITALQASQHLSDDDQPAPDELVVKAFESSASYNSYRKTHDKNGDGYVDSVVFVYSNEIDSDSGYWAWVYWNNSDKNAANPSVNSYLWMSYNFFTGSSYAAYGSGIDSHTAIHETGHLLGLDDYYQYDKNSTFDPSGALEMQSFNIGDQNIYSKFALGWVNPYYVKTESEVTLKLRSSALYGDAILINDSWNHNSMDEYLIIEYYTPQGMNEKDARYRYTPNGKKANKMYDESGFRIYHVDSRIVELSRGQFQRYVDSLGKSSYAVGASNSKSRSYLQEDFKDVYKYLHLLEASGKNTFKSGGIASNATLFKTGSSFSASSEFFANGTAFNDGTEVGYRISINECADEYGSVTISKI